MRVRDRRSRRPADFDFTSRIWKPWKATPRGWITTHCFPARGSSSVGDVDLLDVSGVLRRCRRAERGEPGHRLGRRPALRGAVVHVGEGRPHERAVAAHEQEADAVVPHREVRARHHRGALRAALAQQRCRPLGRGHAVAEPSVSVGVVVAPVPPQPAAPSTTATTSCDRGRPDARVHATRGDGRRRLA